MPLKPIDKKIIDIIDATSFPPVALRIYTLVSRPDTSLSEIEKALSMDPVLSAKTLQVANSPFFNRGRHTDTLDRALTLIGFNAVRMVVLCAAIHELYKKASIIDKKLWAHSLGVSLIGSVLAKETSLVNEHNAAAAGLFHDAGKLVLRNAYSDKYPWREASSLFTVPRTRFTGSITALPAACSQKTGTSPANTRPPSSVITVRNSRFRFLSTSGTL